MSLLSFATQHLGARNRDILFEVCGLRDGIERSMRSVGMSHGLTSERTRQIIQKAQEILCLAGEREFNALTEALQDKLPLRSTPGDATHLGILDNEQCSFAGLNNLFRLLGRKTKMVTHQWGGAAVLVEEAQADKMPDWQRVHAMARQVCHHSGAVSSRSLLRAYNTNPLIKTHPRFDTRLASLYLETLPARARLVGEKHSQHWVVFDDPPAPICRAREYAHRMGRLDVEQAYANRLFFPESRLCFPIPKDVFRWALAQFGFQLKGDQACSAQTQDEKFSHRGLSKAKATMIEILKRAGGTMPKDQFLDQCQKAGMSFNTAHIYLYRYPVFKVSQGVVRLT